MRRGYVESQVGGPVRPVLIEYETDFEDAIVEAISRLDEIGDVVDGCIPSAEIAQLIAPLLDA
jgi:hypothetical protein